MHRERLLSSWRRISDDRILPLFLSTSNSTADLLTTNAARVAPTIPVDVRATLAVALAWTRSTSDYSFFNEMPEFCLAAFFSFSISFFCLLDFGGLFCAFFCSLFAMISSFPYVTEIKTDTTLTLLRVLYQIQCQCV